MSFWSDKQVAGDLIRLSKAIKHVAGSGMASEGSAFIRKLAELVRILERRDQCKTSPEVEAYAQTEGASFFEIYFECDETEITAHVFDNQVLPGVDRMIAGSWNVTWNSISGERADASELEKLCGVLEARGPWKMRIWSTRGELAQLKRMRARMAKDD